VHNWVASTISVPVPAVPCRWQLPADFAHCCANTLANWYYAWAVVPSTDQHCTVHTNQNQLLG